jgi:hypothetical protein
MMEKSTAPDIARNYPSRGERIGPAWQVVWDSMAAGDWLKGADVAHAVAEATGLMPATIKGLLAQAASAGLLDKELRFAGRVGGYKTKTPAVRSAWYRRPTP